MNRNLLFSAFLLFGAQQINAQDVTFGLVSKYTFDNQDVTDEVGVNDGGAQDVFYSSPGFGGSGNAIFFDGYDQTNPQSTVGLAGVQSEIIDFSQSFSISFWFNLTDFNSSEPMILLSSRKTGLGQEAGGIEFTIRTAPINTVSVAGRSVAQGLTLEYVLESPEIENTLNWYFVTLTRNNIGDYRLYLNGTQVDIVSTVNVAQQNNLWSIGCTPLVQTRELQGSIDEVRFYDRVISSSEVAQLYNYTPMTVSIDEAEANSSIRVYPNPTTNVLNFATQERLEYTLFDMSGKMVMTGDVNSGQSLDVSKLDEGIYVVETRNNQEVNRLKVVKY